MKRTTELGFKPRNEAGQRARDWEGRGAGKAEVLPLLSLPPLLNLWDVEKGDNVRKLNSWSTSCVTSRNYFADNSIFTTL